MYKKLLALIFISLISIYAEANENKIIAQVANQVITQHDLNERIRVLKDINKINITKDIKSQIIEQLINDTLIKLESERLEISATEEEIKAHINSIEKNKDLPLNSLVKKWSTPNYKSALEHARYEYIWIKMINMMLRESINITDKEVQQFINNINVPVKLKLAQLVIENDTYNAKKDLINNNLKAINNCQSFKSLTEKVNLDSPTIIESKIEELNEYIVQIANNLPIGKPSEIIDLGEFKQIIVVCDKKYGKPAKINKQQVKEHLIEKKLSNYANNYLKKLRKRYFVEINLQNIK